MDLGPPVDNKGLNDVENIFGFDINGDGKKGGLPTNQYRNLIQIDELQELKNLGYQTFNSSRNLANLWLDTDSGDIYTNNVYRPEDQILLKYTGNSEFSNYEDYDPIPVQHRNIKPLAIEYLLGGDTVPDWAVGGYLLIGADQTNGNSIVGIVYDENGNYLVDIGTPEGNFAVNQTENLFEFDFNRDGKKAGLLENENPIYDNLERIDDIQELENLKINGTKLGSNTVKTFYKNLYSNEIDLYRDLGTKKFISVIHLILINKNMNFLIQMVRTSEPHSVTDMN